MAYLNGKKIALNPEFYGIVDLREVAKLLGYPAGDSTVSLEALKNYIKSLNAEGILNLKEKGVSVNDDVGTEVLMRLIDNIEIGVQSAGCTVNFRLGDSNYEVVSVSPGNPVNEPVTPDLSDSGKRFIRWEITEGEKLEFPFIPEQAHTNIWGVIADGFADIIYEHYNVDKEEYPLLYVAQVNKNSSGRTNIEVSFAKNYTLNTAGTIVFNSPYKKGGEYSLNVLDGYKIESVVDYIIENTTADSITEKSSGWVMNLDYVKVYTNTIMPDSEKYDYEMI